MAGEVGAVNFAGLGSGLDTKAIISALVGSARTPIQAALNKRSVLEGHKNTFSDIKSRMEALSKSGEGLDSLKEFQSFMASSSDDDKITIAAGGHAYPGNYTVDVTTLADAQRTYSARTGLTSSTDALGFSDGDSFTITDGTGEIKTIEVDSTTSLSNVASLINGSGAEVTAGVLYDGTNHYLQISGHKTGADNAFSIDETGISDQAQKLDISNTQQVAVNSSITLDGFTISSEDNIIDEVIPGVTLTLNETTSTAVKVKVESDHDAIISKIEDFVKGYNTVMGRLNEELVFKGEVNANRLQGDGTLRNLQNSLFSTAGNPISGLTGDYAAFSNIGITTGGSGLLEIDKDELKTALNADMSAVADLFIDNKDAGTEGVAKLIQDTSKSYTDFVDGYLTTRIKGLDSSLSDLEDDVERLERSVGAYERNLNAQFTNLEVTMVKLQQQNSQVFSMLSALQSNS